MTITVALKDLLEAMDALRSLGDQKLTAKAAYRVSKLLRVADQEFRDFDAARIKLVKSLDLQPPNGDESADEQAARSERLAKFEKQITELMADELYLEIGKLRWQDIDDAKITPIEAMRLTPFIEEPEEPVDVLPLPKPPKPGAV